MSEVVYRGPVWELTDGLNLPTVFEAGGRFWKSLRFELREGKDEVSVVRSRQGVHILLLPYEWHHVEELHEVRIAQLDGEFCGWDVSVTYRLKNGDVWRQTWPRFVHGWDYEPEVMIFAGKYGDCFHVCGIDIEVTRVY